MNYSTSLLTIKTKMLKEKKKKKKKGVQMALTVYVHLLLTG